MVRHVIQHPDLYKRTRQSLSDGSFVQTLRTNPPSSAGLRSDEELQATLDAVLCDHDPAQDLHVFGYGSLMWNPALDAAEARVARVSGWHRRFCLRSLIGRGSPQAPGAMLALDRGGACRGLLFRIEAAKVRTELRMLWQREMISGSYDARWVCAKFGTESTRALTFVANRMHDRYIGDRSPESVARLISTGHGTLGTARDYFEATRHALAQLGIRDPGIERVRHVMLTAPDAASARRRTLNSTS